MELWIIIVLYTIICTNFIYFIVSFFICLRYLGKGSRRVASCHRYYCSIFLYNLYLFMVLNIYSRICPSVQYNNLLLRWKSWSVSSKYHLLNWCQSMMYNHSCTLFNNGSEITPITKTVTGFPWYFSGSPPIFLSEPHTKV